MRALCAELTRAAHVTGELGRSMLPALSGIESRLEAIALLDPPQRAAAAASAPPGDAACPPHPDARAALLEAQQARARDLFARADADGNGRLDREEFLAAMRLLQHALSDSEMQLALSCMDSHGYLTPEQFAGIVQAEQMCDTECDAEMLRHVPHARPSWWSDAPHCVTDV